MAYRVGEMAELFGLTTEGIRYLEKRGFIRSRRESNGYRTYSYTEKAKLKHIRNLCSMGFSLKEAERMVTDLPRDDILSVLDAKLEDLAQKADGIARMQRMLTEHRALVDRALQLKGNSELISCPEMIFLPTAVNDTPYHDHSIEKEWVAAMPLAVLAAIYDGNDIRRGMMVKAHDADTLALPASDSLIHIQPQLCVHGALETPPHQRRDIRPLVQWAEARGWRATGRMYCLMRMSFKAPDAQIQELDEVYLPVEKP